MTKIRLRVNKAFLLRLIVSDDSVVQNMKLRVVRMGIRKQRNTANCIIMSGKK